MAKKSGNKVKAWLDSRRKKVRISHEIHERVKEISDQLYAEQEEKDKLLSKSSNWDMIAEFVRRCNDNPNLKVEIHLKDGTTILLRCYEEQKQHDYEQINGDYIQVQ